ncbi:MAG: hypothetical protein JXA30_19005 [Deltaproteobacteria bacterium]|nr:hypothetical protein [Deltaproteobacteria bacterium]
MSMNRVNQSQSRGSRAVKQRVGLQTLLLAVACFPACAHQAYPAPAPRPIEANDKPAAIADDPGDVPQVQGMENRCRVRLSSETAKASLAALDRVHEVLGASCNLETVDHDPMHWLLRCRSDALFESGRYELSSKKQSCAELQNKSVTPWECVGAVLEKLFKSSDAGALRRLSLAVVGHVDMQPINPRSDSHLCLALQSYFGYEPEPAWVPVPAEAQEQERQYANNQLAWCRAASVAEQISIGMGRTNDVKSWANRELAVLGLGTSWLRSQPDGVCPNHGQSWQERKDCADARRVDLLIRFEPRVETAQSTCDVQGDDPATALYCLQQCSEQVAVGSSAGSGTSAESVPLFLDAPAKKSEALPDGWYLKRLPESPDRRLDLDRVCDTLSVKRL